MFLTGEHGHRTCATPVRLRRQRCLQLRRCRRAPVLGLQRSLRLFVRLERQRIGFVSASWACLCFVLGAEFFSGPVVLAGKGPCLHGTRRICDKPTCPASAQRLCCGAVAASPRRPVSAVKKRNLPGQDPPCCLLAPPSSWSYARPCSFYSRAASWFFLPANKISRQRSALRGLAFKAFAALASSAASFLAAAFAARLAAARRFCLSFAVSSSWADARGDGLRDFFAPAADGELLGRPCATRPQWPRGTAPERQGRS